MSANHFSPHLFKFISNLQALCSSVVFVLNLVRSFWVEISTVWTVSGLFVGYGVLVGSL